MQTVDAIQKLFVMINAPCLDKVDWTHWWSFAHTLPRSHTPLARVTPVSSEQDNTDKGALAMVRRDYALFLITLIAEIKIVLNSLLMLVLHWGGLGNHLL